MMQSRRNRRGRRKNTMGRVVQKNRVLNISTKQRGKKKKNNRRQNINTSKLKSRRRNQKKKLARKKAAQQKAKEDEDMDEDTNIENLSSLKIPKKINAEAIRAQQQDNVAMVAEVEDHEVVDLTLDDDEETNIEPANEEPEEALIENEEDFYDDEEEEEEEEDDYVDRSLFHEPVFLEDKLSIKVVGAEGMPQEKLHKWFKFLMDPNPIVSYRRKKKKDRETYVMCQTPELSKELIDKINSCPMEDLPNGTDPAICAEYHETEYWPKHDWVRDHKAGIKPTPKDKQKKKRKGQKKSTSLDNLEKSGGDVVEDIVVANSKMICAICRLRTHTTEDCPFQYLDKLPETKVCKGYNSEEGCKLGENCRYVHACSICLQPHAQHPAYLCRRPGSTNPSSEPDAEDTEYKGDIVESQEPDEEGGAEVPEGMQTTVIDLS